MKLRILVYSLILTAASGCNRSKTTAITAAQSASATAVETVAVAVRTLNTTVNLPAQLMPYEAVDIYPKVTGFLESIRVDVGSRVHQGELLMRISAPELVAQRAQAEASLRAAESQLATAQARLASDEGTYSHLAEAAKTPGVVAGNDLMVANQTVLAAKGTVAAAENNVSAARDALHSVTQMESYLTITAPFDGVVTARNLHTGALTGPSSGQAGTVPILHIESTSRLRLVVPIPEAQAAGIKLGQQMAFSVPQYPGQIFNAPVARISNDVDLNTRTMHVELDVRNTDGKLSPGSYAAVSWQVQRNYPTFFVPASAVASDQQHSFVIRVRNSKTEWVTVQTGQTVNGEIEVFGDLHPSDVVVRAASDSIRSGQDVSVHTAKSS
jgi:membrane fusion protein, multidrug efflux system